MPVGALAEATGRAGAPATWAYLIPFPGKSLLPKSSADLSPHCVAHSLCGDWSDLGSCFACCSMDSDAMAFPWSFAAHGSKVLLYPKPSQVSHLYPLECLFHMALVLPREKKMGRTDTFLSQTLLRAPVVSKAPENQLDMGSPCWLTLCFVFVPGSYVWHPDCPQGSEVKVGPLCLFHLKNSNMVTGGHITSSQPAWPQFTSCSRSKERLLRTALARDSVFLASTAWAKACRLLWGPLQWPLR